MANIKISFLVLAYNEVQRIGNVLAHAICWADEVVVIDKGSTDGTLDICKSHGDRVRVVSVPYSERGHEDMTLLPQFATEDWIFYSTCSEMPTRGLIDKCREVLNEKADQLDLIYVPRLMHWFGLHCSEKNGGVSHYPFMFHKARVVITNDIHDNFHVRDKSRTARIPFAEDCCVYHMTHPTARSFWLSSLTYFEREVEKNQASDKALREAFKNLEKLSQRMATEGDAWLPFYCAKANYELGKALFTWERERGREAGAAYNREMIDYLLATEWNPDGKDAGSLRKPQPPFGTGKTPARGLKKMASALAVFPYLRMKLQILADRLFG